MKKKKKFKLSDLIGGLLGGLLGACLGFFLYYIGFEIGKGGNGIIPIIAIMLSLIISIYIHIIIHEGGHLLFGILSGYKFVSFRIASFTLVKEEKFKLKRYSIPGTAGQCLMDPPEYNEDNFPYVLYNLGGGLLNLVASFFAILIIVLTNSSGEIKNGLYIFSILGIYLALTNLIPLNLGGVANDGMNILSIKKSKEARYAFYLQLKANALLMTGTRYKDMPIEWFNVPENLDIKNSINLSRKILEGNYYLDKHNFEKTKEVFEKILEDENILGLYKNEIACELIFCELITDINEEKINSLYTKEIKKYIDKNKFMISKKRTQYAYELLINKDKIKADKVKLEFEKLIKTYPYKGEILSELDLISLIDKKLEERII